MPGSPPMSTSEPGTTPPPRTRSNSSMPDDNRSATTVSMSAYNCGPAAAARVYRFAASVDTARVGSAGRSSTSEFHAPQSAHRPSHFCDCAPHSWQLKTVFAFIELCLASSSQLPVSSFQFPEAAIPAVTCVLNPCVLHWKLLVAGNWQLATVTDTPVQSSPLPCIAIHK